MLNNFTKIGKNTQRAKQIVDDYNNAWATQLYQVYPSHYSTWKASAYDDCKRMMSELGGHDFKIVSACGTNFTVGFIFVKDGIKCLAYITYRNNYYIPLEDARPQDSLDDSEWFENFKDRYENLCPTTKEHLARACPHITSREQAEKILKCSEAFDILFRLEENSKKGTN